MTQEDNWSGMLPNGSITKDENEYIEAWRELARPLCETTGCEIFAFDPNYQFTMADYPLTYVPAWIVQAYYDLATNVETKAERALREAISDKRWEDAYHALLDLKIESEKS